MKSSRFKVLTEAREIELSPLIDMVFILLIFFIVATVFIDESGFAIAQSRPAEKQQEEKQPLIFTVKANGSIEFNGRFIGLSGVSTHVQSLVGRSEHPVIIQLERGSKSGLAVQAMDYARLAGAEIVNFTNLGG
ncbi:MAG: biopolymer transporter ExbD [Opitutae bacterium]|jgi:biopolymer transport protein ExbD|nr:biopolymer transporter ExbD [Opitutae bacterium]MBT5381087.1 biopolymer transporter ExbD [Opitutae bacterium]MBT5692881.1 biopolymer transporter ExbD [Opitutae bacterium]MBT6462967.1 biopolymer transporter ExbD [Opitutae bacterium]MBT6956956.1 biopolymer transporter ExbD [Opitutae bacterium]